jgi:hypothetical protein
LRFLVRLVPGEGLESDFFSVVRSISSSVGVQARNPRRTSSGALEVDLFAASRGDFELCMAALEPLGTVEFSRDLNKAPPFKGADETVAEARRLFNEERYWESHEVLEGLWRTVEGTEKSFVQGVILVCAAFVHLQKGEEEIALGVLGRARRQLRSTQGSYHGLDIGMLNGEVDEILENGIFRPFSI